METMHAAGRRRLPPVPRPAAAARTVGRPPAEEPRSARPDDADDVTEVIDTGQITVEPPSTDVAGAEPDGVEADGVDAGDDGPAAAEAVDDGSGGAEATDDEPVDHQADTAQTDTAQTDTEQVDAPGTDTVPAGVDDPTASAAALDAVAAEVTPAAPVGAPAAARLVPAPRSAPLEGTVERTPAEEPAAQDPGQHFVARLRASAADFADAAGAESAVVREAVPPARHRRARCRLVLRYRDGSVSDVTLLGPAGAPGQPSRHGFDRQILRWLGTGLAHDDAWLVADDDVPGGLAVDLTAWVTAS